MAETWKEVPGFPGYEVSDHGRVRSYMKQMGPAHGGWSMTDKPQRYLKLIPCPSGYLHTAVANNGTSWFCTVHQLVMLAFEGPCPEGMVICHNDGDRKNNRLENLRYDTQSANVREAVWHGNRHFDPQQILEIRKRRANGESGPTLAAEYGVSKEAIYQISTHQTYRGVGGPCIRGQYVTQEENDA